MHLTPRIEQAVTKLYKAFHNNTLHPECCKKCAVGNICNNLDFWQHLSDAHGSLQLNYIGRVHQQLGRKFYGYTPQEILKIEAAFLKGCGYSLPLHYKGIRPENPEDKETLFNGLCAVIELLCELDTIDSIMDYKTLFAFDKKSKQTKNEGILTF